MLNGTVEGHLNVPLFYETLARILSEKYDGVKLTGGGPAYRRVSGSDAQDCRIRRS